MLTIPLWLILYIGGGLISAFWHTERWQGARPNYLACAGVVAFYVAFWLPVLIWAVVWALVSPLMGRTSVH